MLAVLVCLSVWAATGGSREQDPPYIAADPTVTVAPERTSSGPAASCRSEAPGDTGGPDRWSAVQRTSVCLTESIWKSQPHHAEVARAGCLGRLDDRRGGEAARRQTLNAAPHLHDIPLLI